VDGLVVSRVSGPSGSCQEAPFKEEVAERRARRTIGVKDSLPARILMVGAQWVGLVWYFGLVLAFPLAYLLYRVWSR
jgi:hypothetical protein